jgi:Mg/Co/Ni transporter MgtE
MTTEEILQRERNRLNKLMRDEMLPFIIKTVEGNTTTEIIDETKRKEITAKYDKLYNDFGTALLNTPPTYQELRAKEYPSIQEQLDLIYWDKVNGTNVWQKTIEAIKAKYPKDK